MGLGPPRPPQAPNALWSGLCERSINALRYVFSSLKLWQNPAKDLKMIWLVTWTPAGPEYIDCPAGCGWMELCQPRACPLTGSGRWLGGFGCFEAGRM